ncbi:hypothetical protein BH24ACT3_BH24ACT3_15500 [soil metagenome]
MWEVLLAERGRLDLAPDGATWIEEALRRAPLREAPLTRAVALRSRALDLSHDDPADASWSQPQPSWT